MYEAGRRLVAVKEVLSIESKVCKQAKPEAFSQHTNQNFHSKITFIQLVAVFLSAIILRLAASTSLRPADDTIRSRRPLPPPVGQSISSVILPAHKSAMQPPPYWTDCPLIGKPIEGTPFITAKTPIQPYKPDAESASSSSSSSPSSSSPLSTPPSSALPHWSVPVEHTFTLSMLIRYHQQRGMQLGMIVDLTDGRFYEPQPLCRDNKITYINMYIPPPPTDTSSSSSSTAAVSSSLPYGLSPHHLSAFFRLLDTFTATHPSSYLLVHDIYSFDLSLFLIALYLTTNSLSPSLAFHRVCSSRPPGIVDEAMVRAVWAEGGEEVEWDVKAVLKRPDWWGEEVGNWTWSGVGDRMEKRRLVEEVKDGGEEKKTSEAEERKEPIKPAGTVRRKLPKKTADAAVTAAAGSSTPLASSASAKGASAASSSISIASSPDPYADMLADIGLASSAPISSSASAGPAPTSSSSSSSGSHKRKAPSSSAPARPAPYTPAPAPSSLLPLYATTFSSVSIPHERNIAAVHSFHYQPHPRSQAPHIPGSSTAAPPAASAIHPPPPGAGAVLSLFVFILLSVVPH